MHFTAALLTLLPALASAAVVELNRRAAPTESPGAVGFANPPLRGWTPDTTRVGPCGGYTLAGRTNFPVTGGNVALIQHRDAHNVMISYSASSNPLSQADFSPLLPNVTQIYSGTSCYSSPDFSTLGLSAGDSVSLQVTYQAGAGRNQMYQCADVTLVAATAYTPATEFTCANVTKSTQTTGNGNTALSSIAAAETGASSPSSSSAGDKVSPLGAGFIGAAVAIVLAIVLLLAARLAGFARFGKKSVVAPSAAHGHFDAASMTSAQNSMLKH